MARTRAGLGVNDEGDAVGLLVEICNMYNGEVMTEEVPFMSCPGTAWFREKTTQYLRNGIAKVGRRWRHEMRGARARVIPEYSGCIREAYGGQQDRRRKYSKGSD